jgi:hypothetical protein
MLFHAIKHHLVKHRVIVLSNFGLNWTSGFIFTYKEDILHLFKSDPILPYKIVVEVMVIWKTDLNQNKALSLSQISAKFVFSI